MMNQKSRKEIIPDLAPVLSSSRVNLTQPDILKCTSRNDLLSANASDEEIMVKTAIFNDLKDSPIKEGNDGTPMQITSF